MQDKRHETMMHTLPDASIPGCPSGRVDTCVTGLAICSWPKKVTGGFYPKSLDLLLR